MAVVFLRTLIIYTVLILSIKIMGKRQIGELQVSELVTALLLSEIAAIPIAELGIPLLHAVLPLITILSLEVIASFAATKSEKLKTFFDGKPSILIDKGNLSIKALDSSRISVDELMSELRLAGAASLDDVYYAILEQNGKISVILRSSRCPLTPEDCSIKTEERGAEHALIVDGSVKDDGLREAGIDKSWLTARLREHSLSVSDVFLFTVDDIGKIYIIRKEKKQKKLKTEN